MIAVGLAWIFFYLWSRVCSGFTSTYLNNEFSSDTIINKPNTVRVRVVVKRSILKISSLLLKRLQDFGPCDEGEPTRRYLRCVM